MQPRSLARAAGWAVLGIALARPALGANRACEAVVVSADPAVSARWPNLREQVEQSLTGRSEIDRCASVHLSPSADGLTLQVTLQDGRSTTRWVPTPEDVLPGLEALLLLPAPEPTDPEASQPTRTRPKSQAVKAVAPVSVRDHGVAPESADSDRHVGASLSIGGGARAGDGQVSSNLGVMATIVVSDWLMGFEARAASYEVPRSDHVPQPGLELTAVGGHRFGRGTLGIDLLIGPTLLFQQDVTVHQTPQGRASETTTSRVLPRLFGAARLTFGARSVLSGFVGAEGAVGPSGASDIDAADALPPLPLWMIGFVVGATVGLP